jgi:hypothetical protein
LLAHKNIIPGASNIRQQKVLLSLAHSNIRQ